MSPPEVRQLDENRTHYKVFPRSDGTNFWIYAEITRISALGKFETSLEILLPRVRIENLSSTRREQYRDTLAEASEESPSDDPPPQLSRETGLRHPAPVSL